MTSKASAALLIVDDATENLHIMSELLRSHYRVFAATSGMAALRIAQALPKPDLILLDVMMPDMDGYAVLAALKENALTCDIPVIFVTALAEDSDEEYGLSLGAADYIAKPINPVVALARIRTQLEAKQARDWLKGQNGVLEAEVSRRMAENDLIQQVSIRALAHLAEMRDSETGYHIQRTAGYVKQLALGLQSHPRFCEILTDHYIDLLSLSAPLHDIGKVGIPDSILLKPGPLTPDEWATMKTHARLGSDAIASAERDVLTPVEFLTLAKEIACWHHEKWDGSGYPDGLAGDAIPVSARIMAVADVFDALTMKRAYKDAMSFESARDYIAAERGSHFDPDVVDVFMRDFDAIVAIAKRYRDTVDSRYLCSALG